MIKKTDNLFLSDLDSLRLLMDGMPTAIGVAELKPGREGALILPEGRIVFFNRRWEELFGFGLSDVRTAAESTERLYPDPAYRALCYRLRQEAVAQAEREARPALPIALKIRVADGTTREFLTGTSVIGNRMVVSMEEMDLWESPQLDESASLKNGVIAVHRSGAAQQLVPISSIAAIIAEGKYTAVLSGSSTIRDHRGIGEWEHLLSAKEFVRIDRSTIVRVGWIHAIQTYGRGARLSFAHAAVELDIGRAGRERLMSLLPLKPSRRL